MNFRWPSSVLVGALLLFAGTTISAQAATVAAGHTKVTIIHETLSKSYGSSLTVDFHKHLSTSIVKQIKSSLKGVIQPRRPDAGPNGELVPCGYTNFFTDPDGTFSLQHACGGHTGTWGYQISQGLCAIVVSNVTESGMFWTRNGTIMPDQAGHYEGCGYIFHGTFNPENDYDVINYGDNYTFLIEVNGQTGNGEALLLFP
jgi:hypothetical protein